MHRQNVPKKNFKAFAAAMLVALIAALALPSSAVWAASSNQTETSSEAATQSLSTKLASSGLLYGPEGTVAGNSSHIDQQQLCDALINLDQTGLTAGAHNLAELLLYNAALTNTSTESLIQAATQQSARGLAKSYLAVAEAHENEVTTTLKSLESSTRQLVGLEHRLKGEDSLTRKIISNATEDGTSHEEAVASISDILRYTYQCDVDTFTSDFLEIRAALESRGYVWVKVKNTLGDETAQYRGVNTKLKTPDGYTFEIQFHTEESFAVNKATHELYEEQRLLDTSTPEGEKRFEELASIMTEMSSGITTPPNIEQVKL